MDDIKLTKDEYAQFWSTLREDVSEPIPGDRNQRDENAGDLNPADQNPDANPADLDHDA